MDLRLAVVLLPGVVITPSAGCLVAAIVFVTALSSTGMPHQIETALYVELENVGAGFVPWA
jgi:hypothetical protein